MKFPYKFITCLLAVLLAVTPFLGAASATEVLAGTVTGNGVNLRQSPSLSGKSLTTLSKGERVVIMDRFNWWYKISYNGKVGYMSAEYVEPTYNDQAEFGYAVVTGSYVHVRSGTSVTSSIVATLSEGLNVKITGVRSGWYCVAYESYTGYMHPDYLEPIQVLNPARPPASSSTTKPPEKTEGEKIVELAKQYMGIRYVWGGSTPTQGFDCSGLVVWVFREWNDYEFRRRTQLYLNGISVEYSELVPGDLVFFDTGGQGNITHVGIYVGDNKFIHAPKPGTTVTITTMAPGSYYYRTFKCARRIAE